MPDVKFVKEMRASGKSERTVRLFSNFSFRRWIVCEMQIVLWQAAATLFWIVSGTFRSCRGSKKFPLDTLKLFLSESNVSKYHEQDSKAWQVISISFDL